MHFPTRLSRVPARLLLAGILAGALLAISPAGATTITAPTAYPDNVVPEGATSYSVPINITADAGAISGVVGVDIVLRYNGGVDGDVLTAKGLDLIGTDLDPWFPIYNVIDNVDGQGTDEIRISVASYYPDDALTVADGITEVLLNVVFDAISTTTPKSSPLTFVLTDLDETGVNNNNAGSPAIKLGGTTGVLDLRPDPILPGQSVLITLTDADLDQTGGVDTYSLLDVTTSGGETQTVTLTETGATTGIFTGSIATAYGASNQLTGELEVVNLDQISATYADALNDQGDAATDPRTIDVGSNEDGTVGITNGAPINPGDGLTVQVDDGDLNNDPTVSETVDVTVYNQTTGEFEIITLTETGPDTGIFEAVLTTALASGGFVDDDDTLEMNPGDQIVVKYYDAIGANGSVRGDVLSLTPTDGAASITNTPPIKVADAITIQVTDVDLDIANSTRIDGVGSVTVQVENVTTGETESVTLTETAPGGTGIFTGSIPTTYDENTGINSIGGTLEIRPEDDVRVVYQDLLGDSGAAEQLASGSVQIGGTDGTVSTAPATVGASGGIVTVTVTDIDLSGSTGVSADVQVRSNGALVETENVPLTETGAGTGIFTGTIDTGTGAGQLDTQAGDQLVAVYIDADDAAFAQQTRRSIVPTDGAITSVAPSPMEVGDPLTIQVTDADLQTGTRVTGLGTLEVTITVTDPALNVEDVETLTLTETGQSSGVFVGTITSLYDAADDDSPTGTVNGQLELRTSYFVSIDLTDDLGAGAVQATDNETFQVAPGATGTVEITNAPRLITPGTEDVLVRVTDGDLNNDSGVAETVDVTVKNVKTGETETITLTETGPNTGIFEGAAETDATVPGAGTKLGVGAGDQIAAIYQDAIGGDGLPHQLLSVDPLTATFAGTDDQVKISTKLNITLTDDDMKLSTGATRGDGPGTLTVMAVVAGSGSDLEPVLLTETGEGTGIFTGFINTVYDSDPVGGTPDNGLLETRPTADGYAVTVTYTDPLLGDGDNNPVTKIVTATGGATGTLAATKAVQPDDELRIEVVDADLDLDAGQPDIVDVVVDNPDNGDTETITLTETDPNTGLPANSTGVFRGTVVTLGATTAEDGKLLVTVTYGLDNITVTYQDVVEADGSPATLVAGVTGVLWGDTSQNGFLGAQDASLILQHSVSVDPDPLDAYGLLVGDVDLDNVGAIQPNSWDATLVLRKIVGLDPDPTNLGEARFPVQIDYGDNHPFKQTVDERLIALGEPALRSNLLSLPVVMDETADLFSGNLALRFDPRQYRVIGVAGTEATADHMVTSNAIGGQLLIAFAGARGSDAGQGAILEVQLERLGNSAAGTPLTFETVALNGGRIQTTQVESAAAFVVPQIYSLAQNWPNPFNPETSLRYSLPGAGQVRLSVYSLLGQKVRTLVDGFQQAGTYQVQWDGRDDSGRAAASGSYFYRIEAGSFAQTRKMTLLR